MAQWSECSPFTSEAAGSNPVLHSCEKSQSTLCRKSWVFSGLSGFLPQGMLTGWIRINTAKEVNLNYCKNSYFQNTNSSFPNTNSSFQNTNSSFQNTNSSFQNTNSSFQSTNSSFQSTNSSFQRTNSRLKVSVTLDVIGH